MRDVFDIYTIIFLALAVFIFLRLRSVLGQRTGRERPPFDPYSARDAVRTPSNENVVTLPGRAADKGPVPRQPDDAADRWKGIAEPGSALAAGLDAIAREDKTFDAAGFLTGGRAAYEMIVTAYANGDRRQLKDLLAREVYEGFEAAIQRARAARREDRVAFRLDRSRRHHRRRTARQDRADHRALRVAARLGHPRPLGRGDRRQSRQGHHRHRRVDVCA